MNLVSVWGQYLSDKKNLITFAVTVIVFILVLIAISNFLTYNEMREGATLNDPFLSLFNAVNVNWLTFTLIYGALIFGIVHLSYTPKNLTFALGVYSVMVLLRITAMYFISLNPPVGMIPLKDPVIEHFGTGIPLTKDLFFSGHTSTMFLLFLVMKEKNIKFAFLIVSFAVGACVLLQHVHYSIDVIAAPVFAYSAYGLTHWLNKKLNIVS